MDCCLLHRNILAKLHRVFFSCHLLCYSGHHYKSGVDIAIEMILPSFVLFPDLHFFGKPSGTVRDASPVPVPCATHIHPPRDFPPAAPVALYSSFNSPIFCLHSFKIALVLKKSFPKVLPLSQKCVPLHSLSEREAQATSEWIFDRLRTANKTRQR